MLLDLCFALAVNQHICKAYAFQAITALLFELWREAPSVPASQSSDCEAYLEPLQVSQELWRKHLPAGKSHCKDDQTSLCAPV